MSDDNVVNFVQSVLDKASSSAKAKEVAKPPDLSAITADLRAQLAAMTARCQAAEEKAASAERRLDEALQSARAVASIPKLELKPSAYDVRVTSRDAKGRLENLELIPKKGTLI